MEQAEILFLRQTLEQTFIFLKIISKMIQKEGLKGMDRFLMGEFVQFQREKDQVNGILLIPHIFQIIKKKLQLILDIG